MKKFVLMSLLVCTSSIPMENDHKYFPKKLSVADQESIIRQVRIGMYSLALFASIVTYFGVSKICEALDTPCENVAQGTAAAVAWAGILLDLPIGWYVLQKCCNNPPAQIENTKK